jgi:uncharacterized protein (DUF2252 family)
MFSDAKGVLLFFIAEFLHFISPSINNGYGKRYTAIQAVRGARHSGVIGAHRHLHLIEYTL